MTDVRTTSTHPIVKYLREEAKWVALGSILTLLATVLVFQLWNLNPRIPVLYSGDGLLTLNGLRNMKLGNWYWTTDKLGAPFGQDLRDFPAIADHLHLVILWLGIKVFRDEFLVFNGFFFATYLFAFFGGYTGSRMLRLSQPIAVFVGVSYAFLPYHFQHGPGHLYLAAYWPIPIWFAFLVRQLMPSEQLSIPDGLSFRSISAWLRSSHGILVTTISIVAATTGLYYAFFFLALGIVVGLLNLLERQRKNGWFPVFWAGVVSVFCLGAQFFPIWLFQKQNGNNLSIVKRSISAIEFYSLKLSNMVLPVPGHRVGFLANLRERSNPAYLIGEGTDALGLLGALGLLLIIGLSVYGIKKRISPFHQALTILTMSCLLIAMTGGLSFLVGIAGFTQVRVWSRMSIVIAFPAIIVSALLLEKLLAKRKQLLRLPILLGILAIVVLDTNPGNELPSFEVTAREWNRDKTIVNFIEETFGSDASIFHLPQVPFPENPPVAAMADYELLRGYMHSSTFRWSYGAIKGRSNYSDEKLNISAQFLKKLTIDGFTLVWLEKSGYLDRGTMISNELRNAGAKKIFESQQVNIYQITGP